MKELIQARDRLRRELQIIDQAIAQLQRGLALAEGDDVQGHPSAYPAKAESRTARQPKKLRAKRRRSPTPDPQPASRRPAVTVAMADAVIEIVQAAGREVTTSFIRDQIRQRYPGITSLQNLNACLKKRMERGEISSTASGWKCIPQADPQNTYNQLKSEMAEGSE